jgi:hypothetical protein
MIFYSKKLLIYRKSFTNSKNLFFCGILGLHLDIINYYNRLLFLAHYFLTSILQCLSEILLKFFFKNAIFLPWHSYVRYLNNEGALFISDAKPKPKIMPNQLYMLCSTLFKIGYNTYVFIFPSFFYLLVLFDYY